MSSKTITVLMSTYNGEKYLHEQISSLLSQQDVNLNILVRDDGSTDTTINILDQYQHEKVLTWYTGKNLRSARSFLDLVSNAPDSEYYAFCDQDDVWKPDKLKKALEALELQDNSIPLLYCSNYQLVDDNLKPLPDNGHVSTTTFNAALVSSCCTGCTVVFNKTLRDYLCLGIPEVIVMHDDWAHKVCLALGGKVIYDNSKTLYYRQHRNNVDGGRHTVLHKIIGILSRIFSQDHIRSRQLCEINRIYGSRIQGRRKKLLEKVAKKHKKISEKIEILRDKSLRTPFKKLNKGFIIAILIGYF